MAARVFRLFVSSTFEDFRAERDKLGEDVFPKVEELCADHGARFEAIDLRVGISEDAARAQDTMAICLRELERCLASGLRPSLLILLGNRYGWRPLPDEIPTSDFEPILDQVRDLCGASAAFRLVSAYPLDRNTLVPVHRLCLGDNEVGRVRELIRAGSTALPRHRSVRLDASATEREIVRGLSDPGRSRRQAFCCIRNLPRSTLAELGEPWIDLDEHGRIDEDAQKRLSMLRRCVRDRLGPARVKGFRTHVVDGKIDEKYLDRLSATVLRWLTGEIERQVKSWPRRSPTKSEIDAHREFGRRRASDVVGRDKVLRKLCTYVQAPRRTPLLISGESGIGKSALIAAAVERLPQYRPGARIIQRYVGATPGSCRGESLLEGLYREVVDHSPGRETEHIGGGVLALERALKDALSKVGARQPIVLVLDALNQLQEGDEARELQWLPSELPDNVWLIASAVSSSYCIEQLRRKYPKAPLIDLEGIEVKDARLLLRHWLERRGRRLTKRQIEPILAGFAHTRSPLYLRLAANEAVRLCSFDRPLRPGRTVARMVADYFAQLGEGRRHGALFVERSLAYIAASRYGLSHEEVRDALWRDQDVRKEYKSRHRHSPGIQSGIAPLVWTRLFQELEDYLTLQEAEPRELITFFHDQIRNAAERLYLSRDRQERHRLLSRCFMRRNRKPYIARAYSELPYQLCHAGEWQKAERLFSDADFIAGSLEELGPHALTTDIDLALELGAKRLEDRPHMEALRLALAQSTHAIERNRAEITVQLAGRLLGVNRDRTQRLVNALRRREQGTWLEPLTGSLGRSGLMRVLRPAQAPPEISDDDAPRVWDLDMAPDGRTIVSASHDRSVRVWEVATGRTRTVLFGHEGPVQGVCATPDGRRAISAASDGVLILWDLETGGVLDRKKCGGPLESIAITPKGDRALVGFTSGRLWIWNLASSQILSRKEHSDTIWRIAVSPDGRRAATASQDGRLLLWNLSSGSHRVLVQVPEPYDLFRSVQFHPREPFCVVGTGSGVVVNVPLRSNLVDPFQHHDVVVRDLALSRDGRLVVSVAQDGGLVISSFRTGRVALRTRAHADEVNTVHLADDGRTMVTGASDGVVKVWDLPSLRRSATRPGHLGRIAGLSIANGGKHVVSGGEDGHIRFWDAATGRLLHDNELRGSSIDHIDVTPDGRYLVFISTDVGDQSWLHVRRLIDDREWSVPLECDSRSNALAISPSDGRILVVTDKNQLSMFSPQSDQPLFHPRVAGYYVQRILVTPDGRRAIVHSFRYDDCGGEQFLVFDLEQGRREQTLRGHRGRIRSMAIRGCRQLLTGCKDGTLRIWDLATGKMAKTIATSMGDVRSVSVSADGSIAICAGADFTIAVWDLVRARRLRSFVGSTTGISSVEFSPKEKLAISISSDWTLGLWDWRKGRQLATFTATDEIGPYRVLAGERDLVVTESTGGLHFLHLREG